MTKPKRPRIKTKPFRVYTPRKMKTESEQYVRDMKLAQAIIDTAFAMVKGFEGTDLSELGNTENEIRSNIIKSVKTASKQVKP